MLGILLVAGIVIYVAVDLLGTLFKQPEGDGWGKLSGPDGKALHGKARFDIKAIHEKNKDIPEQSRRDILEAANAAFAEQRREANEAAVKALGERLTQAAQSTQAGGSARGKQ